MIDDDAAVKEFGTLLGIMRKLRAPGGCPWDAEQTMSSLRRYILEEAHELVEAIDGGNTGDIAEECGDLLLQVVFVSQIASEAGMFDMKDVCRAICDKLARRHPHVFGDVSVRDADDVSRNWEIIKSGERRARGADDSAMAGIPKGLPALPRALRISERAAKKGFDWRFGDVDAVRAKVLEELDELRAEIAGGGAETVREELGDAFFALANMSRHLGMDPEEALQVANEKFIGRFRAVEKLAADENLRMEEAPLDKLEALWRSAKDIERNRGTEPSGR
ncbi:MAG: nucleoside triphosphate pyrophosphohydrolase [Synergistaceae bacterium]|jgi:XTP/dITP diphosphohydrolase/tetrapyrrole methylase family protein/MazG family protein/ATP diphosphatase|nr:nucleoside triphosphate pyrophosphohydrolase [Synergistaceae bacterium]